MPDSPLSSSAVAKGVASFEDLCACSTHVFWTASRPLEKGRMALFQLKDSKVTPVAPHHSVKSRVHEYGGGAIATDGHFLYFISDTLKALMSIDLKTGHEEILFQSPTIRVAEIAIHPSGPMLYMVGEDHTDPSDIANGVYLFRLNTKELVKVHGLYDFYMSIKIAKEGDKLCFIAWDHPFMSWQESSLIVCHISNEGLLTSQRIAVQEKDESVLMPLWSEKGSLFYISDKTGFWNIYEEQAGFSVSVCPRDADFCAPLWKLGRSFMAEVELDGSHTLAAVYTELGVDGLMLLTQEKAKKVDLPFTSITHLTRAGSSQLFFFGAAPHIPRSLICYDIRKQTYTVVDQSLSLSIEPSIISVPVMISFSAPVKGGASYAFYYPPTSSIEGRNEPVIVRAHGGPTGHNPPVFSLDILFWTSRGFGFLDVNYSGSSGFGRAYRERLKGKWGVYDVRDCIHAAEALVSSGKVKAPRFFIKGSSSGGYTALRAMVERSPFLGAVSYYGIADLQSLTQDSHKFEKHYLDSLLGPYPKASSIYHERSIIDHVDKIQKPILLLQGKEDKVVLPSQAENMFIKLKEQGLDAQLILFDDEGHGFRKAETIQKALEGELKFYSALS